MAPQYAFRVLTCLVVVLTAVVTVRPSLAQTSSGSWTTLAPLPSPRCCLAAAVGRSGRIYAIGGSDFNGDSSTVDAYDPSTNSWTSVAPMPTARRDLVAVTGSDGRIYAIGCDDSSGVLDTVEAYDPSTNIWGTVAPMPTARCCLAAAVGPDGRIYAMGGYSGSIGIFGGVNYATVEAYDPSTNTWATVAPMPTARMALAAVTAPDGRIYAVSGIDDNGNSSAVDAYDSSTDSWAAVAPIPTPRQYLAAATGSDGRIYAIGGFNTDVSNTGVLSTVDAYNPSTNTWSTVVPLPVARSELAAVTGPDGRIYSIGGAGCSSCSSTVEAYMIEGSSTPTPSPTVTIPPAATPTPGLTPTPSPTATPSPIPTLGTHPTSAQLWKASSQAMEALGSVNAQGLTQGLLTHASTVSFAGDCGVSRVWLQVRLRLTIPKQRGIPKREQLDLIVLGTPGSQNGTAWERVKVGKVSWTRWTPVTDGVPQAFQLGSLFALLYSCPQLLISAKAIHWAPPTSGTVSGTPVWHLHRKGGVTGPGTGETTDLYLSKATLYWMRIVFSLSNSAGGKALKPTRLDVRYSRFNEPLNIQPPQASRERRSDVRITPYFR